MGLSTNPGHTATRTVITDDKLLPTSLDLYFPSMPAKVSFPGFGNGV